jgi:hypothetical protein
MEMYIMIAKAQPFYQRAFNASGASVTQHFTTTVDKKF